MVVCMLRILPIPIIEKMSNFWKKINMTLNVTQKKMNHFNIRLSFIVFWKAFEFYSDTNNPLIYNQ